MTKAEIIQAAKILPEMDLADVIQTLISFSSNNELELDEKQQQVLTNRIKEIETDAVQLIPGELVLTHLRTQYGY